MIFIFDIDDTLLPTSKLPFLQNINNLYQSALNPITRNNASLNLAELYQQNISYDVKLVSLLDKLNGKKYIITNASRVHAILSLKNQGILDKFNGIIDANSVSSLKPNIEPYFKSLQMLSPEDRFQNIIFMDDIIQNLLIPKKLGWITYHIYGDAPKSNTTWVDYNFKTIYQALNYTIDNLSKLDTRSRRNLK